VVPLAPFANERCFVEPIRGQHHARNMDYIMRRRGLKVSLGALLRTNDARSLSEVPGVVRARNATGFRALTIVTSAL
jgi:hypothetical protein